MVVSIIEFLHLCKEEMAFTVMSVVYTFFN
jgi:hypothetical protein